MKAVSFLLNFVVPENIHIPTTEGIGHSRGVGGGQRPRKFRRGGGVRGEIHVQMEGNRSSLHTLDCATYQLSWDVPKFKVVKLRYF